MAITRTPIIDDNGTGTTGTILNNAWKQELYGQIDAVVAAPPLATLVYSSYVNLSLTGVIPNYAPAGGAAAIVWNLTPTAAGVYLTGIASPPVAGQVHLLLNTAANSMTLSHQHASSLANNQFVCPDATDFALATWHAVWVHWNPYFGRWHVLKP